MPVYKGTFIFNDCKQGWTESFYTTASTQFTARTRFTQLYAKRHALLGKGVIIEALRVQDIALPRDCGLETLTPLVYSSDLRAARPYDCWLYVMTTATLYCRSGFLRGVPDDWVFRSANDLCRFPVDEVFGPLFVQYSAALVNNNIELRVIDREGIGGTGVPVITIAQAPDGWTVVNAPGITASNNGKVRMDHWEGPDKALLNGVHKVVSFAAGSVVVAIKWADLTGPLVNHSGIVYPQVLVQRAINNAALRYPTKKSTGRAFFVLAGRRKSRQ